MFQHLLIWIESMLVWKSNDTNCRQSLYNILVFIAIHTGLGESMQTNQASWQQHSLDVLFLQALCDWTTATCRGFPWRMDAFQLRGWFWQLALWWTHKYSGFFFLSPVTRGTIALFKERAKDTKTIRALNYPQCRVKPYYSYNCKRRVNNMEGKC